MSKEIEYLDYKKHGYPYLDSDGHQYGDTQKPSDSPLHWALQRNQIRYQQSSTKLKRKFKHIFNRIKSF